MCKLIGPRAAVASFGLTSLVSSQWPQLYLLQSVSTLRSGKELHATMATRDYCYSCMYIPVVGVVTNCRVIIANNTSIPGPSVHHQVVLTCVLPAMCLCKCFDSLQHTTHWLVIICSSSIDRHVMVCSCHISGDSYQETYTNIMTCVLPATYVLM